jgi:hypothetical protein
MQIEIIKPYKKLVVGQKLIIDSGYSQKLIDNGFAKSLEVKKVVEVVEDEKVVDAPKPKAPKAAKK